MVRSVEDVDLTRYLGLWYELGRLPLRFEDESASDVTAEYSSNDDGTVRVDNRCRNAKGRPTRALGQAVPNAAHSGRLKVTFLPRWLRWLPFARADYWILRLDDGYRHALVGTPDRRFLWFLCREPRTDAATEASFLQTARDQGFDLAGWIRAEQSGAVVPF